MNILLVDDNSELREALTKLLVQRGHMVTHAANGLHAMSAVHHAIDPYDALLTDYTMPNMTGVELAQCVQKKSPSTRIAIMSGDSSIADRIPAGIAFLRKGSFGYDEIAQALQLQSRPLYSSFQDTEAFQEHWHVRPDYGKENVYRIWNTYDNYHDDTSPEAMDVRAQLVECAPHLYRALTELLKHPNSKRAQDAAGNALERAGKVRS